MDLPDAAVNGVTVADEVRNITQQDRRITQRTTPREEETVPDTATTAVEQAFLHHGDDGTTRVQASSLTDDQAVSGWLGLLAPHVGPVEGSGAGRSRCLSYRVFPNGFAAVLRQTWQADRPQVVDTHALLGLADQLTPATALTAAEWPGWRTERPATGQVERLSPHELDAPDTAQELRTRALAEADLLARSLAWLLQTPRAPLGLVGCPDEQQIPLLWGLLAIASSELPDRDWTFSTCQLPEPGQDGPGIAFLAREPAQIGSWTVVDVRRFPAASPQNEYRANALVYRYEYGADPPGLDATPAVLPVPAPVPRTPEPVVSPARRSALDPLVTRLVEAPDARAVDGALIELEYATAEADDRGDVRAVLERVGWAVPTLVGVLPVAHRDAALDRVMQVAFGPTLSTGRRDARRIAENSDSDDVVRALVRLDDGGALAQAVTTRWMRQHRLVAPDPAAGLGPVGRFLVRRGRPVSRRTEVTIFVVVAVLVLLACFVAGLLVGGVWL